MAQGFHLHRFDEGFASAFQMLSKLPGARSGKLGYVCQFDAGSGMWLAAAKALGAVRLLGISTPDRIEQAPCVEPELLKTIDLHQVKVSLPQPADLVLCINFIQRLDQARAGDFVADLCKSAPRVLFCAPAPHEASASDENLRWPSFWASHFAKNGYYADLQYRMRIWPDRLIDPALRQNSVLFIKRSKRFKPSYPFECLDVIHPSIYQSLQHRQTWFARQLTRSTLQRLFGESIGPKS
ncbi:MAG: hypothetical protein EBZ06_01245 [Betaproteobacteria bacterium]|nr:hypothetical protein [Betaproteobacteria bacterium]NBP61561.1 hypothetical protein [Betaproteobacteria bacterium]NBS40451.1 hypothetical protein [Betaproteobacteria bacterium]NBT66067.1 hypothetical protein [Betaproteobacteria bacterium]NBU02218.1 hypothetical protein [Betaproteobacteria bacterium]